MEEGKSVKLLDNEHKPRHALVIFLDDNQLAKIVASTIVDYYSRTKCFKHDDTCKVERKKKYRDARILMLDNSKKAIDGWYKLANGKPSITTNKALNDELVRDHEATINNCLQNKENVILPLKRKNEEILAQENLKAAKIAKVPQTSNNQALNNIANINKHANLPGVSLPGGAAKSLDFSSVATVEKTSSIDEEDYQIKKKLVSKSPEFPAINTQLQQQQRQQQERLQLQRRLNYQKQQAQKKIRLQQQQKQMQAKLAAENQMQATLAAAKQMQAKLAAEIHMQDKLAAEKKMQARLAAEKQMLTKLLAQQQMQVNLAAKTNEIQAARDSQVTLPANQSHSSTHVKPTQPCRNQSSNVLSTNSINHVVNNQPHAVNNKPHAPTLPQNQDLNIQGVLKLMQPNEHLNKQGQTILQNQHLNNQGSQNQHLNNQGQPLSQNQHLINQGKLLSQNQHLNNQGQPLSQNQHLNNQVQLLPQNQYANNQGQKLVPNQDVSNQGKISRELAYNNQVRFGEKQNQMMTYMLSQNQSVSQQVQALVAQNEALIKRSMEFQKQSCDHQIAFLNQPSFQHPNMFEKNKPTSFQPYPKFNFEKICDYCYPVYRREDKLNGTNSLLKELSLRIEKLEQSGMFETITSSNHVCNNNTSMIDIGPLAEGINTSSQKSQDLERRVRNMEKQYLQSFFGKEAKYQLTIAHVLENSSLKVHLFPQAVDPLLYGTIARHLMNSAGVKIFASWLLFALFDHSEIVGHSTTGVKPIDPEKLEIVKKYCQELYPSEMAEPEFWLESLKSIDRKIKSHTNKYVPASEKKFFKI